jgi:hypothetical protein
LGLLVWQDTVAARPFEGQAAAEHRRQWEDEQGRMIVHLRGHSCLIMWTVFNEGWSQYDTERLTAWFKKLDPAALVAGSSGWWDKGVGDIYDLHNYSFHPCVSLPGEYGERAQVIGEAGGFEYLVAGHSWPGLQVGQEVDEVGDPVREVYEDIEVLADRYRRWVEGLALLQPHGLNAVVYTQLTDVEHEPNGWLTYDREVSKLPVEDLRAMHALLFRPAPELKVLVPGDGVVTCRLAFGDAGTGWELPDFDDGAWQQSAQGIGAGPEGRIQVQAATLPLFVRLRFELERVPEKPLLRFYGAGTLEVFLGGVLAKRIHNECSDFPAVADVVLPQAARMRLSEGTNMLAARFSAFLPPRRARVRLRDETTRQFGLAMLEICGD